MNKFAGLVAFMLLFSGLAIASEGQLFVRDYSTIPSTLKAGDKDAILQIDLFHGGTRFYRNITVEAQFTSPFTGVKGTSFVPEMDVGSTSTVTLKFDVGDADPGVYTIPVKLTYIDTGSAEFSSIVVVNRYVYLSVSNEPMLQLADIIESNAFVGEEMMLSFVIQNNGQTAASFADASVTLSNSTVVSWIPATQKIDFIPASESKTISFRGIVSGKSAHGSYPGVLTIVYGTKTLTNSFVLDLMGTPSIMVSGVSTDSAPMTGKKVSLALQIENTGTGDAKSTKITLVPAVGVTGNLESYIGTVNAEDTGTAIFDVTMTKTGTNSIPIKIEYTDELGVKHIKEASIDVFNYEAPSNTSSIFVIVVIIAAAGYYLYNRNKKKKSERAI